MVAKLSRPFRIIALPLVRVPHGPLRTPAALAGAAEKAASASASASGSTSAANGNGNGDGDETPLTLYHIQQPNNKDESSSPKYVQYANRALEKAQDQWVKLGEKKEGSVMRWFYDKGEGLMDRMDYEEWALKNVHENQGVKIADTEKGEAQELIEIPLLRPASVAPPLIPKLHRSLLHRGPYHKKMMYRFLLGSPLTWPFAIIPVIPNFPLFYVLWRAWSHYRAWRGATYLESLVKLGMIVEKPSPALDSIYEKRQITNGSSKPASSSTSTTSDSDVTLLASDGQPAEKAKEDLPHYSQLLLTKDAIPELTTEFDLRPAEITDIERAIEQADHRASEAEKVLKLQEEGAKTK